jgi:alpha,alpha-trehalose-phosphate synthase [UDP-forming]/trehalose-phosphatase
VSEREHWVALARWTPLAILADLDGTLIPFAETPDGARPGPELLSLLSDLGMSPGVTVAVVSGRLREQVEAFFAGCEGVMLVAEHGGWRRDTGAWQPAVEASQKEVDDLTEDLRSLALRHRGAQVERKTWSVAFHFRAVLHDRRDAAMVEVENSIARWLSDKPHFVEVHGPEFFEVKPARMDKASAVVWLRERAGARCRLIAVGDDVTDEDMFRNLAAEDESVIVGDEGGRVTVARWRVDSPEETAGFLRWILALRRGEVPEAELYPRRTAIRVLAAGVESPFRLLVVSNRLPELRSAADSFDARKRNVGGLVSALEPALQARQGVWLGWSGRTEPHADAAQFGLDQSTKPARAWVAFTEQLYSRYYNGLCNGALWPLLHSFPNRVRLSEPDWQAYREANDAFAAAAARLVGPKDAVWLHDYHLFLLGQRLRERGYEGPIGLFLHTPFPAPDIFFILPWAEEVLTALLTLDVVGFHTPHFVDNFRRCVAALPGTLVADDAIQYRGRRTRIGAFPIGIIPEGFQEPPAPSTAEEVANLMRAIAPSKLVLGVDRLDYTKGIPERLEAFARLLELYPEWRRKVSLIQISVPSRSDVPEYAEQRQRIEAIVGRTNGEFGEADWVPIRYLYRSYGRNQLSQLYRAAAIGYVTPLRDGMNLVAKEWVAAQNPTDPGVLVLSRFAGAAVELTDALLTNPWHVDGLARDLDRALRMGLDERRGRHEKLLAAVLRTTAVTWAEDFLSTLSAAIAPSDPPPLPDTPKNER